MAAPPGRLARFSPRRIWRLLESIQPLRQQVAEERKASARTLRSIEQSLARIEQKLAVQQKALDRLPEMQIHLDRCETAYSKDAKQAARLATFQASVDPALVHAHAHAAALNASLHTDPCPYVVIDRVLPDDVYDVVVEALPSPVFFKKAAERSEMTVPFPFAPAYSRAVWNLFYEVVERSVLPALVERFRPALDEFVRTSWPALGSWEQSDIDLEVAQSRLLLRRPGYRIEPHRDPRWAFLTAIFYLSTRNGAPAHGTQLYRLRVEREGTHSSPFWADPDECELVRDVPGTGNTALVFLNSTGAHGASIPQDAPQNLKRYVYQVQFSPDAVMKERLITLLAADVRERWVVARDKGYDQGDEVGS